MRALYRQLGINTHFFGWEGGRLFGQLAHVAVITSTTDALDRHLVPLHVASWISSHTWKTNRKKTKKDQVGHPIKADEEIQDIKNKLGISYDV